MLMNAKTASALHDNSIGTVWGKIEDKINSAIRNNKGAVKIYLGFPLDTSEEYVIKKILVDNLGYTVHIEDANDGYYIYVTWNEKYLYVDGWWRLSGGWDWGYKDDIKNN